MKSVNNGQDKSADSSVPAASESATESGSDKREISFADEIPMFVEHIKGMTDIFPISVSVTKDALDAVVKDFEEFQRAHVRKSEDGKDHFVVESHEIPRLLGITKKLTRLGLAQDILPRSFIVSLVSQFDAFLGRLIRNLFHLNPELLNASEKLLSLQQLLEFQSIENAKEHIVEKEIENVLRKSHSEQFDWFEKKLEIPLRVDLPAWPTFIEVTERRNLFVHTDGKVSTQYLTVCKQHGVQLADGVTVGAELGVTPEYFAAASSCVLEIGVKLSQVMWRKLQPQESGKADGLLVGICYELLTEEKFELAKDLLDFSTIPAMKHPDEVVRRMLIMNRAQAYKWGGDEKTARRILEDENWSAARDDFRLGYAVLSNDFESAVKIMLKIGNKGDVGKSDYKEWPLFRDFRETDEFRKTFESIFGEPFNMIDEPSQKTEPQTDAVH